MSIPVRHSGRIAFAALIVITLIAALIGVRMFALAEAPPTAIDTDTTTEPSFPIGQQIMPEGEPVLFVAESDPPGYEDEITWLSTTKYGTAEPTSSNVRFPRDAAVDGLFETVCGGISPECDLQLPDGVLPTASTIFGGAASAWLAGVDIFEKGGVLEEVLEILSDPLGFLLINDPLQCLVPIDGALVNIPLMAPRQVKVCQLAGKLHTIHERLCSAAKLLNYGVEELGLRLEGLRGSFIDLATKSERLSVLLECLHSLLIDVEMYACGFLGGFTAGCAFCGPVNDAGPSGGSQFVEGPLGFEEIVELILGTDIGDLEEEFVSLLIDIDELRQEILEGEPPVRPAVMLMWQYDCHLDFEGQGRLTAHVYIDAAFRPDQTQFFNLTDVNLDSLLLNGIPVFSAEIKHDVIVARFGQGGTGTLEEPCPLTVAVSGLLIDGTPFLALDPAGNPHFASQIKGARKIMRDLGFLEDG